MKKTEIRRGGGVRDKQPDRVPAIPEGSGMDDLVEDILFSVESPSGTEKTRQAKKQDPMDGATEDGK